MADQDKIGYVNGLRGIAILMVLYHHLIQPHYTPIPLEKTSSFYFFAIQPFQFSGWLGVNIFFVLSGFVLFLPFARSANLQIDSVRFLKKRAVRLLPLYYLNVLVCLVAFVGEPIARFLIHSIAYVLVLFPSPELFFPPMNPPLWSLGIEIWFSILFPAILILMRYLGIANASALLIILSLAVNVYGSVEFQVNGKYLNSVSDTLPGRLSDFCIGMLAAHFWIHVTDDNHALALKRRILLPSGVLMIYLSFVLSVGRVTGDFPAISQTFANLFLSLGIALLILALRAQKTNSTLRSFLEIRGLQVLGMMCFSVYIWHWQIIHVFNHIWGSQNWIFTPILMLYFLALLLVSGITYRFVEFRRKGVRDIFLLQPKQFQKR
ncbi:acyltransferase family protein [Ruegeria faecimaris]|uniref:acyltransferase family protein n=1 Tax=Ruegeria faecimaris TaxID=686389 RepID=UPI0024918650|nr:acyltransferase [Ruegeria faecimaris]